MPMTKAGVRAMDVVTEFLTSDTAPEEIQQADLHPHMWQVSGGSKVLRTFLYILYIFIIII